MRPRPRATIPTSRPSSSPARTASETFLLDAWIGRDRHGQATRLVDLAVAWECYVAGVEAVAAQTVTADAAAQDGRVPIMPITRSAATGGKERRALGLSVRLGDKDRPETCRVWVLPGANRDTDHGTLTDFLTRFPHGRYDDPVDATIDAVELAHRATTRGRGGSGRREVPGRRTPRAQALDGGIDPAIRETPGIVANAPGDRQHSHDLPVPVNWLPARRRRRVPRRDREGKRADRAAPT